MSQLDDMVAEATSDDSVVTVDFSGALDFSPLEGTFNFIIEEVESGRSAGTPENPQGNPKVVVKAVTIDAGELSGRKVQKHLPLKGKGSGITKAFLEAVDMDTDDVAANGLRKSDLVGRKFNADCRKSSHNPDFTDVARVRLYVEPSGL